MRITLPSTVVQTQLQANVADLQSRITIVANESVTGRYDDITGHLNGKIGYAMLSEKAIQDLELERSNLTLQQSRYDMMQASLGAMYEAASGVETLMASSVSTGDLTGQEAAGRDAMAALEEAFSYLNVRHGERYLFAGDDTATLPLGDLDTMMDDLRTLANGATSASEFEAAIDTYFNDPDGGWQSSIYQGSTTSSDPDGILAIDPAITDFISNLAVMALAAPGEDIPVLQENSDILARAATGLAGANASVTNMRADLGVAQAQIERQLSQLDAEELLLVQSYNDLTARDQYEAAVELEALETSLEASYLLTSRLSEMSILNYL